MFSERENTTPHDRAPGTASVDGLGYISVKGFKSIRSIENLALGPVTVLIGANGSGKSNFIEVFSFLDALREGRMMEYVITAGRADRLLHYGSRVTDSLELKAGLANGSASYHITLHPTTDDMLAIATQVLMVDGTAYWGVSGPQGFEASIRREMYWRPELEERLAQLFDEHRVYRFFDAGLHSAMKSTPSLHDNRYLRPDAANIAAFLYLLRVRHPDSYRSIVNAVNLVAPFFVDFDLEPERLNPEQIRLRWKHAGSNDYFDASSLSEGTLRFIALATLFLQPVEYRPAMVIVDEPELGLHPHAITVLGGADAAGFGRNACSRSYPILTLGGPVRTGGHRGDGAAQRSHGLPAPGRLRTGRLAGRLQPGPIVGEECSGRPAGSRVAAWSGWSFWWKVLPRRGSLTMSSRRTCTRPGIRTSELSWLENGVAASPGGDRSAGIF